jgi:citrate lyase beta subunit
MLLNFEKTELLVFIRPRNSKSLEEILKYENIEKIDGFILPKFSLQNARDYLALLEDTNFLIMPSIEGKELFESTKLLELKDILAQYSHKIILIRFGLEDMLRQLKMRRKCEDSIFDVSVTSSILGNFLAIFKSAGFEVSGGVYPCFEDKEGFARDVLRDLKEGLFSKTIIHPSQIEIINDLYKVDKDEYEEARKITTLNAEVGAKNGKMLESKTMSPYAEYILKRADTYGIKTRLNQSTLLSKIMRRRES